MDARDGEGSSLDPSLTRRLRVAKAPDSGFGLSGLPPEVVAMTVRRCLLCR